MVLSDVTKTFEKVWHNGLKYKLIRLGLPDILQNLCVISWATEKYNGTLVTTTTEWRST